MSPANCYPTESDPLAQRGHADRNFIQPTYGMVGEQDPTGRSAKDAGAKLDAGKPRIGLVLGGFARALTAVSEVGTLGAAKYSDSGWMEVPDGERRYTDAMLRHYFQEQLGEKYDRVDMGGLGTLHAAQVAWNALARLELMLREENSA